MLPNIADFSNSLANGRAELVPGARGYLRLLNSINEGEVAGFDLPAGALMALPPPVIRGDSSNKPAGPDRFAGKMGCRDRSCRHSTAARGGRRSRARNRLLQNDICQFMTRNALRLAEVTCTFPERGRADYCAVEGACLNIAEGEFVSLVGPTGCGKSTLLNVAAGLLRPTAGSVEVFGESLAGMNRQAGYLFQGDSLFPWRTARENVMLGLELRGEARKSAAEHADAWLARVHLSAHCDKYPHELSGGMRKRVSLAQTLILDPKILLMDEPFSALDVQTRSLMENELLELWSHDRKSVAFVTHDLEEAISLSDRVVVLSAGPASHPVGEFRIDLARPRDVSEVRLTPQFLELHRTIWDALKVEVHKAHVKDAA